uniref:N-acetylgalactosaminide beta-1,3-galactosyltransferase n=1 Tax=Parastrongyloides trichosuri TaxID=131310 RepID=A0A0N4Z0V2_PARTI
MNPVNSWRELFWEIIITGFLFCVVDFMNASAIREEHDLLVKYRSSFNNSVFEGASSMMEEDVKVFCIILTSKTNINQKAIYQKNTWLKRCSNYIFSSGEEDEKTNTIKTCDSNLHDDSFCKAKNTFKYVWKKYGSKYDWYAKFDDETYVIMENLRGYLINRNPNDPKFYGQRMNIPSDEFLESMNYKNIGSGYLMSRSAMKLLVEKGFKDKCKNIPQSPDYVAVGKCFENLGITKSRTFESSTKYPFYPFTVPTTFNPLSSVNKNNIKSDDDEESISDFPIAFNFISPQMMYAMEYFLYKIEVLGQKSRLDRMIDSDSKKTKEKVYKRYDLIKAFSKFNFIN